MQNGEDRLLISLLFVFPGVCAAVVGDPHNATLAVKTGDPIDKTDSDLEKVLDDGFSEALFLAEDCQRTVSKPQRSILHTLVKLHHGLLP
jgi:hypothetical protein